MWLFSTAVTLYHKMNFVQAWYMLWHFCSSDQVCVTVLYYIKRVEHIVRLLTPESLIILVFFHI